MKKTRLISALALLLSALMLFSACSVNYRTADYTDYLSLTEAGYKNLKLEIAKMKVEDEDVWKHINGLRYEHKKAKDPATDVAAPLAKYDVLELRYFLCDEKGYVVQHNFTIDERTTPVKGELSLGATLSLPLGYEKDLDHLSASLENSLFLSNSGEVKFNDYWIEYSNVGADAVKHETLPLVVFGTYNSVQSSNIAGSLNSTTATTPIHLAYFAALEAEGKPLPENSAEVAIYLGLKKIFAEGKGLTPTKKTSGTINIVTYSSADKLTNAETTATRVEIPYALDVSKDGKTDEGATITFSFKGAAYSELAASGAFKTTYKFPEDAKGTYTADGKSHEKKNVSCTAYVYFEKRTGYDCPDYNADFITNTLKEEGFKPTGEDIVAEHFAYTKQKLQHACDEIAKKEATSRLWDKVMVNTQVLDLPSRNVEQHVKAIRDSYKSAAYDMGYMAQMKIDNFEDFVVQYIAAIEGKTYATYADVEDAWYAEARQAVKTNLLTYYLAELLGVRYTDGELEAQLAEKHAAWAKKQAADMIAAFTPKENATDKEKQNLKDTLAYYGYSDVSEIKAEDFPLEMYIESYGEENLYGGIQLDRVIRELYAVNYVSENGNATYKDTDFDPNLLPTDLDSHEGHNHD